MDFGAAVTAMIGYVGDVMGNANISPYVLAAAGAVLFGVALRYGKRIIHMLKV